MTVSTLVARIRRALAGEFDRPVCVVGEISNLKVHTSGHVYFRLKDAESAIDAAMFRSAAGRLKFQPADGLEVVAEGRVDLYGPRGQLQLYVERLTPKGAGALELAFRQLREKLQKEGLFDPARKVPLRRFPRAIGVITSPTGAAIRDIRRALRRRWPAARVYLLPTLVQGEGAAEQVAAAIRRLDANADRLGVDTIIVGRGGGSLEDLWAFNEEAVARAVFAARTPIISGVGHEADVTICDLVADVRAATPTAAAEMAVPDRSEVSRQVLTLFRRLRHTAQESLRAARAALAAIQRSVIFRDPAWRVRVQSQRLDELAYRLRGALRAELAGGRNRLEPLAGRLAAVHPARLAERARASLAAVTSQLRWILGGRSKQAGDALAALAGRLTAAHPRHRLHLARQQVVAAARQLESMSYRSVLGRGFSVTRLTGGAIIRSVGEVKVGVPILTEVADGRFRSTVAEADGPRQTGPREPGGHARRRAPPTGRTLFEPQE